MKVAMKTNLFRWLAIAAAALGLAACSLDKEGFDPSILVPSAVVTVKPDATNDSFCMQLDDRTVLQPVNMKTSPFGTREVRALVNYREPTPSESQSSHANKDFKEVYVNWLDSILTKKTVPSLGEGQDEKTYGNDGVEIFGDWCTVVEDGYLTLHFQTYWGPGHIQHVVNLVTGTDPADPYKVVFRHNANGDNYGQADDAIVAFSLKDLPDTQGETVDLTLEWLSFSGVKSAKFKYCTRDYTAGPSL